MRPDRAVGLCPSVDANKTTLIGDQRPALALLENEYGSGLGGQAAIDAEDCQN